MRGALGCVIVYDIGRKHRFKDARQFVEIIRGVEPEVICFLVGNKCDLETERVVSRLEGQQLADELHCEFLETSAKTSHNVDVLFHHLAELIQAKVAWKAEETAQRLAAQGCQHF